MGLSSLYLAGQHDICGVYRDGGDFGTEGCLSIYLEIWNAPHDPPADILASFCKHLSVGNLLFCCISMVKQHVN